MHSSAGVGVGHGLTTFGAMPCLLIARSSRRRPSRPRASRRSLRAPSARGLLRRAAGASRPTRTARACAPPRGERRAAKWAAAPCAAARFDASGCARMTALPNVWLPTSVARPLSCSADARISDADAVFSSTSTSTRCDTYAPSSYVWYVTVFCFLSVTSAAARREREVERWRGGEVERWRGASCVANGKEGSGFGVWARLRGRARGFGQEGSGKRVQRVRSARGWRAAQLMTASFGRKRRATSIPPVK
eukprot:1524807-Prymnesium_polylepis.1